MNASADNNLAWLDLETTGLAPHGGRILELAIVATTPALEEVGALSLVVKLAPSELSAAIALCDPTVLRMHARSGLIEALADAAKAPARVFGSDREAHAAELAQWDTFDNVMIRAGAFMAAHECLGSPMCGSTISFDRAWLELHAPSLHAMFHYRNIDVSSLKELARRCWLPGEEGPAKREAHRALADVRESIEVARYYRERFSKGFAL